MTNKKIEEYSYVISDYMGTPENTYLYYNSLDALLPVIKKIETEDLSEYHYKWVSNGETMSNFMGIDFTLWNGGANSEIELELDPPRDIACSFDEDLTWTQNTFKVVVETIKYINKVRNENI